MPERFVGRHLGRFRIDAVIGSGGFAWVYKGYDPELDIPVAVKILKPQYAGDDIFESRFRREASTAAKLRHPNIIRILAVGRQDDAVYFVMDYLPSALDDRLRIMGTLPEPLLIRLGLDVSLALAFAHREGVIHRDIKTDNILFDEHGNAIVADFGIARAVTGYVEQTGTNMVVGTPQYFSPEQARGLPLDGRADIYSLGVTLYRAATGVLPFQGEDWYDIARRHVEEQPQRPRALNPALSRDIERVILTCLAKDPDDRYPTGEALHADLVRLTGRSPAGDEGATVVLPTPVKGIRSTSGAARVVTRAAARRHRMMASSAGAMILIVAGVLAWRAWAAHPGAEPVGAANGTLAGDSSAHAGGTLNAAGDSPGVRPPVPAPPPEPAVLRVDVPAGARVRIDNRSVGTGPWSRVGVRPGTYRVTARVVAIPGCASAMAEETVYVEPHGTVAVTLAPRPCGRLVLDGRPVGSRWIVSVRDSGAVADGTLPADSMVVLPVGHYTLAVSHRYCADYRADVEITAAADHHEWVRLICERQ